MPTRKPILIVLAVALVLLTAYVGAYYALLLNTIKYVAQYGWRSGVPTRTHILQPQLAWRKFFRPMNWVDRRIRPHVWEPPARPTP